MTQFNAGKASVLAIVTTLFVAAFLLGSKFAKPLDVLAACNGTNRDNGCACQNNNQCASNSCVSSICTAVSTPTPTTTPTPTPTPTATPTHTPGGPACPPTSQDPACQSSSPTPTPTNTPTSTATTTATPTTTPTNTPVSTTTPDPDVCDNIDGIQTGVPDGLHLDASGLNCVSFSQSDPSETGGTTGGQVLGVSTTNGQVLGASTMAGAGSFAENLYLAMVGIGGMFGIIGITSWFKKNHISK